jgi:hypothetical protein
MFKLPILIVSCVLILTGGAANANTLEYFNISGTFGEEFACINGGCGPITPFSGLGVSGTFVLDVDNGDYSVTLNVPGVPQYSGTGAVSGIGLGNFYAASGGDLFEIWIPPLFNSYANFIEYTGGPIGGGHSPFDDGSTWAATPWTVTCNGPFGPTTCAVALSDLVGTKSPEVSGTPLPAALPLFATGLGGLGLFGWRRKRKNAAAIAAA